MDPNIDADGAPRSYGARILAALKTAGKSAAGRSCSRGPGAIQTPGAIPGIRTLAVSTSYPERRSFQVTVDASEQVLALHTPTEKELAEEEGKAEATIHRSFAALNLHRGAFFPAAALALKAKAFDDGLYAAVELGTEGGLGKLPGKKAFLRELLEAVTSPEGGNVAAAGLLASAVRLAGEPAEVGSEASAEAEKLRSGFLEDPVRSKPLGFYTWSRELTRIFQRDRWLQSDLPEPPGRALAAALSKDESLLGRYSALLGFVEKLTNPPAFADLRGAAEALAAGGEPSLSERIALFPPSRSHEAELVKKLYGDRPIPDGFNLADEMAKRIREGSLDLLPRRESGWYDHQVYALEPLVIPEKMPEAQRLSLADSYRKDILGLFKAILALTRETHVKQLEIPLAGARFPGRELILSVSPGLSLEPLATYYVRRARSYRFIRGVLEESCGPEAVSGLRRLTPGGPIRWSLLDELRLMEAIFQGAHVAACEELGAAPEAAEGLGLAGGPEVDREAFRRWAEELDSDPDLGGDIRTMVPVFYDIQRGKLKVWAVLGVASKPLEVAFSRPPAVKDVIEIKDGKSFPLSLEGVRVEFVGEKHRLAYVVTAEAYVSRLMDRQEFRAHCDRYKTQEAILAHLK